MVRAMWLHETNKRNIAKFACCGSGFAVLARRRTRRLAVKKHVSFFVCSFWIREGIKQAHYSRQDIKQIYLFAGQITNACAPTHTHTERDRKQILEGIAPQPAVR